MDKAGPFFLGDMDRIGLLFRAPEAVPAQDATHATSTVEAINQEYMRNPAQSVIRTIRPQELPGNILEWDPYGEKVDEMVEHDKELRRRQLAVSGNRLRMFGDMVESCVNPVTGGDHDPIPVYMRPARPDYRESATDQPGAANNNNNNNNNNNQPAFRLDEDTPDAARDYQYANAVGAALNNVEVTGVFRLSKVAVMGVQQALTYLEEYDPDKFADATIDNFLPADGILRQMALLTAECIVLSKMKNPDKYYKDADRARQTASIADMVERLARSAIRDAKGTYSMANAEEQTAYRREREREAPASRYDYTSRVQRAGRADYLGVRMSAGTGRRRRY